MPAATLITNVWLVDRYYGPDHGNADDVPEDLLPLVPRDAWGGHPPAPAPKPKRRSRTKAADPLDSFLTGDTP